MDCGLVLNTVCCADLDAKRLPCDGHNALASSPVSSCPMTPASSGRAGAITAIALAAEGDSSGMLLSKIAEEGTLLMLFGVLGSESPCNQALPSEHAHAARCDSVSGARRAKDT